MRAIKEALGPLSVFKPLEFFLKHLDVEYGGFRHNQMQRNDDFRREKEDTPRTMYTRLAQLLAKAGNVFI